MTIGPRAESLTLPEPARTIFSRTRPLLDAYITPHTPDRSGWKIGGGTILAARWRHRESQDIDLLVHPRTETRFLQPAVAPELHRRLETLGARKISFGRFSQILFDESRIEMLAADPQPQVGHRRAMYQHLWLHSQDGVAVVETEALLGHETRTYDRPDDLANDFERDGVNALLAAAGIDPERIREETATAMRTGENTVILELDQDRATWGPYLPRLDQDPS